MAFDAHVGDHADAAEGDVPRLGALEEENRRHVGPIPLGLCLAIVLLHSPVSEGIGGVGAGVRGRIALVPDRSLLHVDHVLPRMVGSGATSRGVEDEELAVSSIRVDEASDVSGVADTVVDWSVQPRRKLVLAGFGGAAVLFVYDVVFSVVRHFPWV